MNPLIPIHIVAGTAALLAGAAALAVGKGSRLHARAGTIFFAAMLAMAGTGAAVAAMTPERGTALIGVFTCYLVVTAWAAARRRDGGAGSIEGAALAVAIGCAVAQLSFGLLALNAPNGRLDSLPALVHFPFAVLAALAAALDLHYLRLGKAAPAQRIGRHLWRMCTALLIAAFSFFLGQQDEFPEAWRGAYWSLPPLAVLITMIFWVLRLRFSQQWRRHWPRTAAPTAPALMQAAKG